MKHLLDSPSTYLRYDPHNALNSIETLPDQCLQAWKETKALKFPKTYKSTDQIVIAGMGGSGLGAHIIKHLFIDDLKKPFSIIQDYTLPKSVTSKSLVICISYSGNTEETLELFKEAKKRKSKLVIITNGGKLAQASKRTKTPAYIFDDKKTNFSAQPRMGIGLILFGLIGILKQIGILKISQKEVLQAIKTMRDFESTYNPTQTYQKNQAKKLAGNLFETTPLFIGSEHIIGNLRTIRNQTNETAKTLAYNFTIPEMNHHLLEGLSNPKQTKQLNVVFITSNKYKTKNKKRYEITKEIIKKEGIKITEVQLQSKNRLSQCLELLQIGSYITLYLAMLNKTDPIPVKWVDHFKQQLK